MARSAKSKKKPTPSRSPARAGRNSTSVEKMQLSLKQRILSRAFIAIGAAFIGALIIIFLSVLWFNKIYADPQHVFWTAIKGSLATQSITKDSLRSGRTSTSQEFTTVVFSPDIRVHDVKQITDATTRPASKLTLETIATATTDYQHYSHIERPRSHTTQRDYQKIYDAWLKNGGQEGSRGQITGNTLFGAVLFGDFNSATRGKLYNELRDSYQVDFSNVNKQAGMSRRVYTYHVTVPLNKYAAAARDYALALNLPLADQINPSNYRSTDKLSVNITVDVLSREITKIEYINQGFSETYSGQGNAVNIQLPAKTVSAATFENAIKTLNQ
jgi:hypothetical protein